MICVFSEANHLTVRSWFLPLWNYLVYVLTLIIIFALPYPSPNYNSPLDNTFPFNFYSLLSWTQFCQEWSHLLPLPSHFPFPSEPTQIQFFPHHWSRPGSSPWLPLSIRCGFSSSVKMFSRLLLFYFFTPPLPYAVYIFSLDDLMHAHDFVIIFLLMTSKFTASFSILPVPDPYVQCQCLLLSLTRSTVKFKMFNEGFLFSHKHVTAYIHYLVELHHHHRLTEARMRSHPNSVLSIYSLYWINHYFLSAIPLISPPLLPFSY